MKVMQSFVMRWGAALLLCGASLVVQATGDGVGAAASADPAQTTEIHDRLAPSPDAASAPRVALTLDACTGRYRRAGPRASAA